MAVTGKSKLKLLCLIDIFTRKTDSSHVLTSAEICGELSKMGIAAERKSVYRDIDSLKEYGYDINRVRAPKSGFYLGKRSIDTAEAQLIADVMANVDFLSAGRKREVIEKILSPLSEYQSAAITAGISDKASNEPFADTFSVLSSIHTAIERKRKITLKYARRSVDGKSLSAEMKEFTLSPYALIWSGEHYYLVANNGKYDNLMHLRADRIVQAALTGKKREMYPRFRNTGISLTLSITGKKFSICFRARLWKFSSSAITA